MGAIKALGAAFGIGESPAEKARKKAKRAITVRKGESEEDEAGKLSAAQKLGLISTSSQGVLKEASTGRKKLLGN